MQKKQTKNKNKNNYKNQSIRQWSLSNTAKFFLKATEKNAVFLGVERATIAA